MENKKGTFKIKEDKIKTIIKEPKSTTIKYDEKLVTISYELKQALPSSIIYGKKYELEIPLPLGFIGETKIKIISKLCDKRNLSFLIRYDNAELMLKAIVYNPKNPF